MTTTEKTAKPAKPAKAENTEKPAKEAKPRKRRASKTQTTTQTPQNEKDLLFAAVPATERDAIIREYKLLNLAESTYAELSAKLAELGVKVQKDDPIIIYADAIVAGKDLDEIEIEIDDDDDDDDDDELFDDEDDEDDEEEYDRLATVKLLAQAKKKHGWSQQEISQKLRGVVKQAQISNWLRAAKTNGDEGSLPRQDNCERIVRLVEKYES